jgi:hypothetical protein
MTIRRNHRAFSLRCFSATTALTIYIHALSLYINNLRLRADLHLGLHQGAPLHFYADIDFYSHSRAPHTGYISRRGWKKCMCAHVKIYKIYRGEHMMYIYIFLLSSPRARTLAHQRRTQISKWNFFRTHLFCDTSLLNYVHWRYSRTNSRAERCFAANRTGQFNDPLLTTRLLLLLCLALHPLSSGFVRSAKKCSGDSHHTFDAGFCGEKREVEFCDEIMIMGMEGSEIAAHIRQGKT